MKEETVYLCDAAGVLQFQAEKPLDAIGMLEVRISPVRNGVADPSPVADLLTPDDFQQLLDGHRASGYQECDRFGHPVAATGVRQVPPPPSFAFAKPFG